MPRDDQREGTKTMKKLTTLTLIGASALTLVAGAAAAQPYGGYDRGPARGYMPIEQRLDRLNMRIDRGVQSGQLDRREARRLHMQARDLERLSYRYGRDGLSGWERADLDSRFDRLSAQIRFERSDDQYGSGYGPNYRR
jgi:hypothetical protein